VNTPCLDCHPSHLDLTAMSLLDLDWDGLRTHLDGTVSPETLLWLLRLWEYILSGLSPISPCSDCCLSLGLRWPGNTPCRDCIPGCENWSAKTENLS